MLRTGRDRAWVDDVALRRPHLSPRIERTIRRGGMSRLEFFWLREQYLREEAP